MVLKLSPVIHHAMRWQIREQLFVGALVTSFLISESDKDSNLTKRGTSCKLSVTVFVNELSPVF